MFGVLKLCQGKKKKKGRGEFLFSFSEGKAEINRMLFCSYIINEYFQRLLFCDAVCFLLFKIILGRIGGMQMTQSTHIFTEGTHIFCWEHRIEIWWRCFTYTYVYIISVWLISRRLPAKPVMDGWESTPLAANWLFPFWWTPWPATCAGRHKLVANRHSQ